jgi:hypothetical protein
MAHRWPWKTPCIWPSCCAVRLVAMPPAFERFERDRKPRVEKIVAEGRRRAADKEVVNPLRTMLRELMMRIFIPPQGEKSQQWILDYKIPGAIAEASGRVFRPSRTLLGHGDG